MAGRLSLLLLLVAVTVLAVGCGDPSVPKSIAGQLYVGDNPSDVNVTASDLAPYNAALAEIRRSCTNSEKTLGNWAVGVLDTIAKNTGANLSALYVLRAVAAAESGQPPHGCMGDFAIVGLALQAHVNGG